MSERPDTTSTTIAALLAAALADTESGSYVHQPVLGRHQKQAAALLTRLSDLGWRMVIVRSKDEHDMSDNQTTIRGQRHAAV